MLRTRLIGSVTLLLALGGGTLYYLSSSQYGRTAFALPWDRPDGTARDDVTYGAGAPAVEARLRPISSAPPLERAAASAVRRIEPMALHWQSTVRMIERIRIRLRDSGPLREVDYDDLSGRGSVPLTLVMGAEEKPLSEHFRVGDFAASDGAAYARISLELVDALGALQEHLGRRVYVNSGYRHPALNFSLYTGGAAESIHMAGLAADVWVEDATPLEVAQAALDTLGCEIGLGLGANFVHVDLRGWRASWSREGAAMDEVDFDLWVLERCGGERPPRAIADSGCPKEESGLSVAEEFREEMIALAGVQRKRGSTGAIVLDLRPDVPGYDASLKYRLGFAAPGSPLLRSLSLESLLWRAEDNDAFVYVVVAVDGSHDVGLMDFRHERAPLDDRTAVPHQSVLSESLAQETAREESCGNPALAMQ